ncbi:hypothetical protein APHAL10511_003207 [Amanita phalloides]|nr:hypothetical protein APHAL10511_003207 [Amanita phalloides]
MKLSRPFLVLASLAYCACASFKEDLEAIGATAVFPGDSDYGVDSASFNRRYTFQPAAIVYPTTPGQISRIVEVGVKYKYSVVSRSGGHSYIANGVGGKNGALVIDMGKRTNINIDSSSGLAILESGNRLGDIALALAAQGRALPHGLCPYVGIGGHASFGGWGFTSRMWGLTLDNIRSMDIVLANSSINVLTNTSHQDLFWAMRGAGPSFGITTAITVQTFPLPPQATIYSYIWSMSGTAAAQAISSFQKFAQTDIPPEYMARFDIVKGQEAGKMRFILIGAWFGPPDRLSGILAPYMATVPKPDSIVLKNGTYIEALTAISNIGRLSTTGIPDKKDTFYTKSLVTPQSSPISDIALTAFMNYLANEGYSIDLFWFVQLDLFGGKNSVSAGEPLGVTSFGRRDVLWLIQMGSASSNHKPPYPHYGYPFLDNMVASVLKNSPPDWDYGAYPNYADDRLTNWQHLYYGTQYPLLQRLKRIYDPENTFSFQQSVEL